MAGLKLKLKLHISFLKRLLMASLNFFTDGVSDSHKSHVPLSSRVFQFQTVNSYFFCFVSPSSPSRDCARLDLQLRLRLLLRLRL